MKNWFRRLFKRESETLRVLKAIKGYVEATHFKAGSLLEISDTGKPLMCVLGMVGAATEGLPVLPAPVPAPHLNDEDEAWVAWWAFRDQVRTAVRGWNNEDALVEKNRSVAEALVNSIAELHPNYMRFSAPDIKNIVASTPSRRLATLIAVFNDRGGREDVLAVVNHAIAQLEKEKV